jgi:hypothetical protein
MMILRAVWILSAFVCVAAAAQTCSGGAGGGADASGNQCSAAGTDGDSAPPVSAIARPAVAIAAPSAALVRPTGSRSKGAAVPASNAVAQARRLDRFPVNANNAKPPAELAHTVKIEQTQQAACSGGADGGMDATGNQCDLAGSAASVLVSKVH